jgi:hypothetical protein
VTKEEMVALSERGWASFNERDWDGFFANATPDIATRTDPRWPDGGEFIGREEIVPFIEAFLEPWDELRYERSEDPEVVGGKLVEKGAWVGTGRSTGIAGRIDFTSVLILRGGLIERLDVFFDHEDALEFARTGKRPRG